MSSILFYLIAFTSAFHSNAHDLHLSVCEIDEKEDGKIELVFRVFFDDLQRSMHLTPGTPLPNKYKGSDELINDFLLQHILLKMDDNVMEWTYSKSELSLPAVWTTVTLQAPKNWKTFNMKNDIMINLFDDQVNVVHIKMMGKKKSYSLNAKNQTLLFER